MAFMASVWATESGPHIAIDSLTTSMFQRPPEVTRLQSLVMAVPQTLQGTILKPNLCNSSCSQAGEAPA
jgi:hypothetical protein